MALSSELLDYLKEQHVAYEILLHPKRDTALATAEIECVPSSQMLKVVMVKIDGRDAMFVLPADRMLDISKIEAFFSAKDVRLERETEFEHFFLTVKWAPCRRLVSFIICRVTWMLPSKASATFVSTQVRIVSRLKWP